MLGFLNLAKYGEEYKYSANIGILNIIDALKWIQENIESFGGDPNNVTLFGQSGGGSKITALMASPLAKGLFERGIVESGGNTTFMSEELSEWITDIIISYLEIEDVEQLQSIPYEDLLEAGVKITDAANGKYGLGFAMSRKAFGDSAGFCFSVIASYGGRILDEEGNLDIDTPEMRAAIQYLIDVWNSGAVPSAATTWDGNSNNQFFLTGDIGIVCNSNSIMGKLNAESAVKPEQLIMLPLPKGPTGHGYQQATPESITIFETANVANAEEFVKYLLNTETQLKMFETMGFGYYSPLKKDVINNPMFADLSDNEKVLLNSGDQYISASFPGEPDARLTQLYSAFFYDDILSHIAVDGWNVDQIIDEMEKVASEMLFS